MSEKSRPPKVEVSPELRDYYASLRTGDNIAEVIKRGRRKRVQRRIAEEAINTSEVVDDSTVVARRHQRADGTVANLGPNYIKRRNTDKETGEQEKNDE